ncbi:MAG: pyruvate kinase [Gaiellaceae bacterium]
MKVRILCTLGPASLNGDVITQLDLRGVDLFRINLSHTPAAKVEEVVELIRRYSSTPICLDTQGAQVRCGAMTPDVVLREGSVISLTSASVTGTDSEVPLWPASVFGVLAAGTTLSIDFDAAVVEVIDVQSGTASALVQRGGRVRSNKAVTVEPGVDLPPLSDDDLVAIEVGCGLGIDSYALSFAGSATHVAELRSLAPPDAHIIAKIESRSGLRNMDEIIDAADSVLVDRGDLSREVPIEQVPYFQKAIARRANRWNRPLYVATNLLESRVTTRLPSIAEANDVANTLFDGVHGLVLAAETAIGIDPVGAVDMIQRCIRAFERSTDVRFLEERAADRV